jgi:cytochrome c oxidase cbb3-type subunit III
MRADSTTRWILAAGLILAVIIETTGAAQTGTAQPRPGQARPTQPRPAPPRSSPARGAPADAEAVTRRVCGTTCHPFEMATAIRRTRGQWEATIENMIGRGARATNAEFATVIEFLSQAYGLGGGAPVRMAAGPDDKPLVDPKASEMGTPLYGKECLACHGADARGTPAGPNLVRSLTVLHDRYGNTLGPYLRTSHPPVPVAGRGAAATGPKFEALTNTQVLLLAHFLRDRINDTLRGAPMFKPGNVLTGDPRVGADYFNGEGGCTQCHSPTGDLAGIGKRMEPVALQQRVLFPQTARRTEPGAKVVTVTVTTESGETLSGPLERMDDFTVSLRDASGNYRSVRRTPGTRVVKNDPFDAHVQLLSRITDKNIHDVVAYLETLK